MRYSLLAVVASLAVAQGAAHAQQPYPYPYPYQLPAAAPQQQAPQTIVVQPQTVIIQQSPQPAIIQQPASGQYPQAPAQPPQRYQPPASTGYYYPPPGYAAPIYSYPPPAVTAPRPVYIYPPHFMRPQRGFRPQPQQQPIVMCPRGICGRPNQVSYLPEKKKPVDRARYFSLGARATSLTINQQIGGKTVTLGGGGVEMRFRSAGRVGLEASVDWLHGNFELNGPISRQSTPIELSLLLYIFPNADSRHFNLYFLGGAGVIPTKMSLTDPTGSAVQQSFTEYEGHLGVGAELRFKWIALRADVRGLEMWRDNGAGAAPFYAGQDGGPVPAHSMGIAGTLGGAFWF